MAGPDGVYLLDAYHLVHIGLIEQRRTNARAQTRDHPAPWRTTEGHRADAVHCDDPHRPTPLPKVVRATHQSAGSASSDKQHVQTRKLASDRRCRRAVVGLPVVWIGVLIEPH